MTPSDHMSQDMSYFSGPSTSGASNTHTHRTKYHTSVITQASNYTVSHTNITNIQYLSIA